MHPAAEVLEGMHQLQHDAAVLAGAGGGLRRSGAKLISPFCRPIRDWFKGQNREGYAPAEEPGRAVRPGKILHLLHEFGHATGGDGRELPQRGRNPVTGGMRIC